MATLQGPASGSFPESSGCDHTFVGGKRESASNRDRDKSVGQQPSSSASMAPRAGACTSQREAVTDSLPTSIDRYQEIQEIGRGGCGVVVRAYDRHLKRDVVIKRLLPHTNNPTDTIARFLNEARITGRLEHPGIVPVHEIGRYESDDTPFYVMKWLHGETLADAISKYHRSEPASNPKPSFHEMLTRFHQICQTLAYAHGTRVIHRDLKPSNIMLGRFGETVVLDWGLAKELPMTDEAEPKDKLANAAKEELDSTVGANRNMNRSSKGSPKDKRNGVATPSSNRTIELTQMGAVMGTAAYMSPEQARGESHRVSYASDVFSLGVILYELLTGVCPFRNNSVETTLKLVARAEFKALNQRNRRLPRALDAICNRALQLHPRDRYADAGELATDIASYLAGDRVAAYRESWWGRLDRIAGKHRTLVRSAFLAMFAIAMVSIVGAAWIHQARQAENSARIYAEKESVAKEVALGRERVAHRKSLEQLESARKAVDAWLINLSGDLQYYPGLEPVRRHLLEQAELYYQSNSDTAGTSNLEKLEAARAEIRLGDVTRLSHPPEQAAKHYQKAFALLNDWNEHRDSAVRTPQARLQSANALLGQALCLLEDSHPDSMIEGQAFADRALQEAQHVLSLEPENRDALKTWIRSRQCLARLIAADGKPDQGAESLNKAIAQAELVLSESDQSSHFSLVTHLIHDQARMYEAAQHWPRAADSYQRLVQLYSQRIRNQANRPDWLEGRSHAHLKLGKCYAQLLNPQSALAEYEASETDLQNAWQLLHDDGFFRENLAISGANFGSALYESGDLEQAESCLRNAITQLQQVIQREGSSSERIARMAHCFLSLAETIGHQKPGEFESLIRDSGVLLGHLETVSYDPIQRSALELRRAWIAGNAHAQAENWSDAKQSCEDAIQHRLLPDLDAGNAAPSQQMLLGKFLAMRADCLLHLGNTEQAQRDLLQARELWIACTVSEDVGVAVPASLAWVESVCDGSASPAELRSTMQIAERTTELAGKHPATWHWLAISSWKNHRMEAAKEALKHAKRLRAQPSIEDQLLEALLDLQNHHHRKVLQDTLREISPQDARFNRHCRYLISQWKAASE